MDETPMHIAYEEAKKDATELNIPVTGSEVVGLLPLKALLGQRSIAMPSINGIMQQPFLWFFQMLLNTTWRKKIYSFYMRTKKYIWLSTV